MCFRCFYDNEILPKEEWKGKIRKILYEQLESGEIADYLIACCIIRSCNKGREKVLINQHNILLSQCIGNKFFFIDRSMHASKCYVNILKILFQIQMMKNIRKSECQIGKINIY